MCVNSTLHLILGKGKHIFTQGNQKKMMFSREIMIINRIINDIENS